MRDCRAGQGQPWLECLLVQILVVVASTLSGEAEALLCVVEDWSGAGFHTNSC